MRKSINHNDVQVGLIPVGAYCNTPLQTTLPEGWFLARIDGIAEVNPRIDKSQIPDDLLVSFVPMPAVGAGNGYIDVAVPLPPFFEQQFIVEEVERRLSVAEEIEVEIETNLERAERLRQSILKKAFSGRLV